MAGYVEGFDHVADAKARRLPSCPMCHAKSGEVCRQPNGRTRPPHKARLTPVARRF